MALIGWACQFLFLMRCSDDSYGEQCSLQFTTFRPAVYPA
jgi:hypothetical protein